MSHRSEKWIPRRALLVVMVSCSAVSTSWSQAKIQKLDALIEKYHEYGQFNGSVLVAEHGTVVFEKGYGQANKEWNIPNAPDTKFRLGSITKQFTATLILQLVEQGKIKLDGKITDYVPEYPKATGDKITIHHLLTHTSGLPNYTNLPEFQKEVSKMPYAPGDFLKVFWNLPLDFEPGTKFSYSNSGYFVLGVVIEKVTGQPYAKVVEDRIFKPLGMMQSGYDMPENVMPLRASGYQRRGGSFANATYVDMTTPYSAGALYSTVNDLYRWDQALYNDKILSEKSKSVMFAPRVSTLITSGPSVHYAYGWFVGQVPVGTSADSVYAISHGGSINGFNSLILRIPKTKDLVVLLNNTGGAPLSAMAQAMVAVLYDKPYGSVMRSIAEAVRESIGKSGIEAATAEFKELQTKKNEFYLSESDMNNLGYEYLANGKTAEAIAVFKLNVEAFPQSSNVYDSLGEAYAESGEKELAIRNYEKSLELNPKSKSGIEALKKLKAK